MIPAPVVFAVALFGWAALSLIWSDDPRGGAVELCNGAGLLAVFLLAAFAPRDRLPIQGMAVIVVFLGVVLSILFPHWNGGFANENFQAEFFLIAIPLLFAANGRWGLARNDQWVPAALLACLAAWFVWQNPSNLKFVGGAFVVGWVALLIHRVGQYTLAQIVVLGAVVSGFWSGVLTRSDILDSLANRAELYIGTLSVWLASPLVGHGIGSFNLQYPKHQEAFLSFMPAHESVFAWDITKFAGAAHNEYLQILADYGLVGGVLLALLIWSLCQKWRDGKDVACAAALLMAGVLSLLEFPAQNPHTGALIALAAGVVANGRAGIRIVLPRPARMAVAGAMVGFAVFVSAVSVKTAQASVPFAQTYFALQERQNYQEAVVWNIHAYNTFGWPRHIRHQLALSLAVLIARDPEGVSIEPSIVDEIFRISESASGRSNAIEVARVEYLFESGRYVERWPELQDRVGWLTEHASTHTATWLVHSKYALAIGDNDLAVASAERALSFKNTTQHYRDMARYIMAASR